MNIREVLLSRSGGNYEIEPNSVDHESFGHKRDVHLQQSIKKSQKNLT